MEDHSISLLKVGEPVVVRQLYSLEMKEQPDSTLAEVEKFLEGYQDIFQKPQGLPPNRNHEQQIPLKKGAQPFKLKPYHYPHFQKVENRETD